MLSTQFENIWMEEKETFTQFHTKLNEIVNSMRPLGESIPERKIY